MLKTSTEWNNKKKLCTRTYRRLSKIQLKRIDVYELLSTGCKMSSLSIVWNNLRCIHLIASAKWLHEWLWCFVRKRYDMNKLQRKGFSFLTSKPKFPSTRNDKAPIPNFELKDLLENVNENNKFNSYHSDVDELVYIFLFYGPKWVISKICPNLPVIISTRNFQNRYFDHDWLKKSCFSKKLALIWTYPLEG